jgi:hypothetical protein
VIENIVCTRISISVFPRINIAVADLSMPEDLRRCLIVLVSGQGDGMSFCSTLLDKVRPPRRQDQMDNPWSCHSRFPGTRHGSASDGRARFQSAGTIACAYLFDPHPSLFFKDRHNPPSADNPRWIARGRSQDWRRLSSGIFGARHE